MIVTVILFVTDVLIKVVRINFKIGLKIRVILKFRQQVCTKCEGPCAMCMSDCSKPSVHLELEWSLMGE